MEFKVYTEEQIKTRQHNSLINFIIDDRNPIEERIHLIKYDHGNDQDKPIADFIHCAGLTLCATYLRWKEAQDAEKYETCEIYSRFVDAYKKLFRQALRTYSGWTIPQFNAMEITDDRLQKKFFGKPSIYR